MKDLDREQILWLGGYLSGLGFSGASLVQGASVAEPQVVAADFKLTVLYGSHSGNSKLVAEGLAAEAKNRGVESRVISMPDYKLKELKTETHLLVVVSTHGEGEPPVAAEELHKLLAGKRAGDLSHLNFAVVALGDSSYINFCQTGIDFHQRLQTLGGKALGEVVKLDVDFKDSLASVKSKTLDLFHAATATTSTSSVKSEGTASADGLFEAEVLERINLNGRGSAKETYHLELSLEDSGLTYQPGDALEVFAKNEDVLVDAIISKLALQANDLVKVDENEVALKEALLIHREITTITLPVLTKLAGFVGDEALTLLLDKREEVVEYLEGLDLLDFIQQYNLTISAQQLIDTLRKLPPRAYSIASSQQEVDEEVHLTVGAVRYTKNERLHNGLCSVYLADRVEVGEKVLVRVKTNDGFRLPQDEKVPVIMIGPGTGIAPFRAFLQERAATNASGKNWLFFGDQHFTSDFLYQTEVVKYRSLGLLKVDVAFSRDQNEKVYVQHRLKENAKEVYEWLTSGAYLYVCGDRKRMAADVKQAFVEIIAQQAGVSLEAAEAKLTEIRQAGRYQEDVY